MIARSSSVAAFAIFALNSARTVRSVSQKVDLSPKSQEESLVALPKRNSFYVPSDSETRAFLVVSSSIHFDRAALISDIDGTCNDVVPGPVEQLRCVSSRSTSNDHYSSSK
jgi:hypothetical protein